MFEDANFGDMYETRNGQKAVYLRSAVPALCAMPEHHKLYVDGMGIMDYFNDGQCIFGTLSADIMGRATDEDNVYVIPVWKAMRIYDTLSACYRRLSGVKRRAAENNEGKKVERIERLMHDIKENQEFLMP